MSHFVRKCTSLASMAGCPIHTNTIEDAAFSTVISATEYAVFAVCVSVCENALEDKNRPVSGSVLMDKLKAYKHADRVSGEVMFLEGLSFSLFSFFVWRFICRKKVRTCNFLCDILDKTNETIMNRYNKMDC